MLQLRGDSVPALPKDRLRPPVLSTVVDCAQPQVIAKRIIRPDFVLVRPQPPQDGR